MKSMKRNAARLLLFAFFVAGLVFVALQVPKEAVFVTILAAITVFGVISAIISHKRFGAGAEVVRETKSLQIDHDDLIDQIKAYSNAARRADARSDLAYKQRSHPGRWFARAFGLPDSSSLSIADGDIREYRSRRPIAVTRLTEAGPEVVR
ncbi:hypothetical protein EPO04_00635 [Patescibacteria group bacterium]|nr:MAG: hypothetical protein EPO04_00635 [Patescibacteria group bacterium]